MNIIRKSAYILILFVSLIAASKNSFAAISDFKSTAKIDSTTMFAGSQTMLNVDFAGPLAADSRITIDTEKMDPEMEINSTRNSSLSDLGNNRKELKESFLVQVFDSGLYTLPPILCISGNDTIVCNSPVIRVDPFPLDTANLVMADTVVSDFKIHDYSDLAKGEKKFFDFVPDWIMDYFWWIIITLVVLGGFIFVYFKWLRHGRIPLIPVKKPVPPYELAISRLNHLQDQMLWQKGAEKEYYTKLTDILRSYLDGRFGINAMEMTTPQILDAISEKEGASEYSALIGAVLNQADFVKFAKARPQADENQRAFANVKQYVELTRPAPNPEEENKEGKNSAPSLTPKVDNEVKQAESDDVKQ